MNNRTAKYGRWTSFCGIVFRTRAELFSHRKICKKCSNFLERSHETRRRIRENLSPEEREELRKKRSAIQKEAWAKKPESRKKASENAVFNNFWKYRSKNPILYESLIAGKMKLDSKWELLVAQRLDSLGVEWYRPHIRLPYLDKEGVEHGYFPDFYVKSFNCFIEVKSPFIANYQNSKNKCEYIKEHYKFVKWLETENQCKSFELQDLGCDFIPEKEIEDISYWLKEKEKPKKEKQSRVDRDLEKVRWEQIQKSSIDFSKFGWVGQLAKIFGVSLNKAGSYVKLHYPEFYKTCYKRK